MSVEERSPARNRAAWPERARPDPLAELHFLRDLRRGRGRLAACPEIDCLHHRLPPGTLAAAELRASEIGIGADQALIAAGEISENDYAQALANSLGIAFDRLETVTRSDCPSNDDLLLDNARKGYLHLRADGIDLLAIAPHGQSARLLIGFLGVRPGVASRVRLTTQASIERFIRLHAPAAIGRRAAFALVTTQPQFSAATVNAWKPAIVAVALVAAAIFLAPSIVSHAIEALLAFIFLGWIGLRLLGALTTGLMSRREVALAEDSLPVYSVIVALYRETAALPDLVNSLAALDYPGIRAQTPQDNFGAAAI